jgi:hypothetical protein
MRFGHINSQVMMLATLRAWWNFNELFWVPETV